ncbi:unnamed protein product [Ceratitis capitata]|uniref:(Mediterranean fruit fly) hypothetical protein n=1 Tax=Ceratitis capitata TaxID=7213 RepID=A0A811VA95_CERCA|nr:unnamed protein product [Ceratitis capitata]
MLLATTTARQWALPNISHDVLFVRVKAFNKVLPKKPARLGNNIETLMAAVAMFISATTSKAVRDSVQSICCMTGGIGSSEGGYVCIGGGHVL